MGQPSQMAWLVLRDVAKYSVNLEILDTDVLQQLVDEANARHRAGISEVDRIRMVYELNWLMEMFYRGQSYEGN